MRAGGVAAPPPLARLSRLNTDRRSTALFSMASTSNDRPAGTFNIEVGETSLDAGGART